MCGPRACGATSLARLTLALDGSLHSLEFGPQDSGMLASLAVAFVQLTLELLRH